jgi:hypothetical protein
VHLAATGSHCHLNSMALQPFLGASPLFQFLDPILSYPILWHDFLVVGSAVTRPPLTYTGIRTSYPSASVDEDSSCLRQCGHCGQHVVYHVEKILTGSDSKIDLFRIPIYNKTKNKLHGLSPRANYTDRATAVCRRSHCQLLRIEGVTWSA